MLNKIIFVLIYATLMAFIHISWSSVSVPAPSSKRVWATYLDFVFFVTNQLSEHD